MTNSGCAWLSCSTRGLRDTCANASSYVTGEMPAAIAVARYSRTKAKNFWSGETKGPGDDMAGEAGGAPAGEEVLRGADADDCWAHADTDIPANSTTVSVSARTRAIIERPPEPQNRSVFSMLWWAKLGRSGPRNPAVD